MELERAERVADGIYGTILVLAVVAALSQDDHATAAGILGGVLATAIVFWIVHVYAAVIGAGAAGERAPVRRIARKEWPLVEAALAPAVPLLLGALGVFSRHTAVTLSLIVGVVDLAWWGYAAGRALKQNRPRSVLTAAGAVALGVVMVLLKNLVH